MGNPDLGWRRRYNAVGTEEWARDDVIAGQPSDGGRGRVRARPPGGRRVGRVDRPRGPGRRRCAGPGPLMPDAPGLELIAGELRDAHPDSVLGTYHEHGQACLIVDPEQVLAVLRWLRDTPGQEYTFLASLHGVDYLPAEPRFGVHYELLNRAGSSASACARRSPTPAADPAASGGEAEELPELESCVELFPTAEFQEREVYDFFGIVFRGHPDLRRILMPEDYVGWPQRRDFPIGGEPVIFTHNEHEVPGWYAVSEVRRARHRAPARRRRRDRRDRGDGDRHLADRAHRGRRRLEPEHELLTINMGPHHPATHGVLRLLVSLQGEVVLDLKPVIGYVHTGIEKSCEDKSYWKVIPFVERMDYLSYFFNMEAFCGAVERLLELEIPPRAKYLRTLFLELNRIHSHLVWLGTSALDLGAISMFWYTFRERDTILDLFEMATGPAHAHPLLPGRRRLRGHPGRLRAEGRARSAPRCRLAIDQYEALLDRNEIFLQRTKGVGIVPRERLLELGVTGPAAARRRRALGPAQGGPVPRLRRRSTSRSRSAPSATATTATASACRRCASRCGSSSSASTGCPRGRGSPTTARSCCRRATSSRPRWRR